MDYQIEALGYPLPEDIEKLKWHGDYAEAIELIHTRLGEDIPETLKEKLRIEEKQMGKILRDYVITQKEAEEILNERLVDYQSGELDRLRRENVVDWMFVEGEIRYIDSFYSNLIKIRADIAARQKHPKVLAPGEKDDAQIRNEIIDKMKREGTVTCRMKLRATVTLGEELAGQDGEFHIHVPLPLEKFQMSNVNLISYNPAYSSVAPPDAHQRTVYFAGSAQEVKQCQIEYSLVNTMHYVSPDPDKVSPEQPDFDTGELLPHIAFTPYLRALTREIVGNEANPLKKARKIYDFVTTKVVYSYMRSYVSLPVIPEYCASRLRGDCGVQALTFITMCRIAGIPARWQSGLYADWRSADSHDWAMFYVAPYGWMYCDCSFGGAAWRQKAYDRWDFYFCNLDPYRVCLTDEFQADFQPPMSYLRSDPYDNQRGEVEKADGPVDRSLWDGSTETLECVVLGEN